MTIGKLFYKRKLLMCLAARVNRGSLCVEEASTIYENMCEAIDFGSSKTKRAA